MNLLTGASLLALAKSIYYGLVFDILFWQLWIDHNNECVGVPGEQKIMKQLSIGAMVMST